MSSMEANVVLKLIDKLSPGLRKVATALNKIENRRGADKSARASRQQARMLAAQERAVRKLARNYQSLGRHADKAARMQLRLAQGAKRAGREFRKQQQGMAAGLRKARNYALAGSGLVLAQASMAAAFIKRHLIDPAAEFEKYEAVLKTLEGSSEKARKSLDWVSAFAAKTPFELGQVLEAFKTLKGYGLDPANGLLATLGDTATAMGRDLMQAVEAVADAVTGENERLKGFNIKAFTNKNRTTYEYTDRDGKQRSIKVDNRDRAAILKALTGIFDEKFGGAMTEQAKTWNNMMTNLGDSFTRFKLKIMNAGLFDWMKGKLEEVLAVIDRLDQSGQLDRIASDISGVLTTSLKAGWEVATAIAKAVREIGSAIDWAAQKVGGYENLTKVIMGLAALKIAAGIGSGLFAVARGLKAIMKAATTGGLIGGAGGKGRNGGKGGRNGMLGFGAMGLAMGFAQMPDETDEQIKQRALDNRAALGAMPEVQAIIKAWDRVKEAATAARDGIVAAWGNEIAPRIMTAVRAIRDKVASIDWSAIRDRITSSVAGIGDQISATFNGVNLYAAGEAMLNSLWEGMKAKAAALLSWASGVGTKIRNYFASGGTAPSGGSMPGSGAPGQNSVIKRRDTGGNFNAGDTIMTGERGRELLTVGRSGTVTPNHALGSGQRTFNVTNNVTVRGSADQGVVAELVDQLDRRFRASLHDIEAVS